MGSNNLVKGIIKNKKEVFYPLFTICIGFLIYGMIYILIDFTNSLVALLFLLWSLSILIFRYALDLHNVNMGAKKEISKKIILILFSLSTVAFFIVLPYNSF